MVMWRINPKSSISNENMDAEKRREKRIVIPSDGT
jgi:hypothetical protein